MRGSRPGERRGGRQKGTPNKRTAELQQAVSEASAALEGAIPGAFGGDAHALLMSVYKDPAKDWALRLDAAKAAIRYEKPALAQVQANHSGDMSVRAFLLSLGDPDQR